MSGINNPPASPFTRANQFQKDFFPFEAFGADDPNVVASPVLELKSPWLLKASPYYDVGTWAPTIVGATTAGTQTYDDQTGHFVKIGPLIHIQGRVSITAKGATMAGNARIGSLPYPVRSAVGSTPRGAIALSQFSGVTLSGQLGLDLTESASYMRIYINSLSGDVPVSLGVSALAEATYFVFGGTYLTD